MRKFYQIVTFAFLSVILTACKGDNMTAQNNSADPLSGISDDVLSAVSQQSIYFGHQSVGRNILDGVNDILTEKNLKSISVAKPGDLSDLSKGRVVHSLIGQNGDPSSKINEFANTIDNGIGNNVDVAFMKYCYVDVVNATNVEHVFNEYKNTMQSLKQKYPNTTFIHMTVPVTINKEGFKTKIKKMLGKTDLWEYNDNVKRNTYNELLLAEYAGKEPIFDLAKVESTLPNGERLGFELAGKTHYTLVPEYSYDGSHLNEEGRQKAAVELIKTLADVAKNQGK